MTSSIDQRGFDAGRRLVALGTALPPPRPGVRHVRLAPIGIVIADDRLRDRVDRVFHWPMIVLALLVLPLLGFEVLREMARARAEAIGAPFRPHWIDVVTWTGFMIIWAAFLVEFVVKITIAESRLEYVRRHWIDAVIILVPVLRPLRVASVAKTSRVFTLRGVGMKVARYAFTLAIGLEATERMLDRLGLKAERDRADPRRMTRHELIAEVRRLRRLVDRWEAWHDAHEDHAGRRREAGPPPHEAPPADAGPAERDRPLEPAV